MRLKRRREWSFVFKNKEIQYPWWRLVEEVVSWAVGWAVGWARRRDIFVRPWSRFYRQTRCRCCFCCHSSFFSTSYKSFSSIFFTRQIGSFHLFQRNHGHGDCRRTNGGRYDLMGDSNFEGVFRFNSERWNLNPDYFETACLDFVKIIWHTVKLLVGWTFCCII